jgi:hypothetical protein
VKTGLTEDRVQRQASVLAILTARSVTRVSVKTLIKG